MKSAEVALPGIYRYTDPVMPGPPSQVQVVQRADYLAVRWAGRDDEDDLADLTGEFEPVYEIELFRWWMPDPTRRAGKRLSSWKMTRDDAAARGLTELDPTSREVRRATSDGFNHSLSGTAPAGYRRPGE
jgi:hypothetical protein